MMNNILSTYTYGLYTLMCGDNICIIDTACQVSSVKEKPMYMSVSINKGSDTAKLIKEGEDFVYESILGTLFKGKIVGLDKVGEFDAVRPQITAAAYITGFNHFVIDDEDPVKYGFILK